MTIDPSFGRAADPVQHRSLRPEVAARRNAELEAAASAVDVARLQERWVTEDAAAQAAETLPGQFTALQRRVSYIERYIGSDLADIVARALGGTMRELRAESAARIAALEGKIAELEQRRFVGAHVVGRKYFAGNQVLKAGGLWHCNQETRNTPGHSAAWQLVTKSGDFRKETTR